MSPWVTHGFCHLVAQGYEATMVMMALMNACLGDPMTEKFSAWATRGFCHLASLDCASAMGMMAMISCLIGRSMVFVHVVTGLAGYSATMGMMVMMKRLFRRPEVLDNGCHWFARLQLVGSTIITGLLGYSWRADDGHGEMFA